MTSEPGRSGAAEELILEFSNRRTCVGRYTACGRTGHGRETAVSLSGNWINEGAKCGAEVANLPVICLDLAGLQILERIAAASRRPAVSDHRCCVPRYERAQTRIATEIKASLKSVRYICDIRGDPEESLQNQGSTRDYVSSGY